MGTTGQGGTAVDQARRIQSVCVVRCGGRTATPPEHGGGGVAVFFGSFDGASVTRLEVTYGGPGGAAHFERLELGAQYDLTMVLAPIAEGRSFADLRAAEPPVFGSQCATAPRRTEVAVAGEGTDGPTPEQWQSLSEAIDEYDNACATGDGNPYGQSVRDAAEAVLEAHDASQIDAHDAAEAHVPALAPEPPPAVVHTLEPRFDDPDGVSLAPRVRT